MKRLFFLVLMLTNLIGCSPYVHSAPSTVFPLESAKALNKGEWGVQGEVGGGGQVFGPGVAFGNVRARHGVGNGLELSLQASAVGIGKEDEWKSDSHRGIYAGRVGMKYELAPWIAFTAGVGGGGSAGGGFVSPDGGLILAFENRYVVPFVATGIYYSQPIHPREIHFRSDDGELYSGKPDRTWGAHYGGGVRIPVSHEKDGRTKSAFLLGIRGVTARHREPDVTGVSRKRFDAYLVGSAAVEVTFD